MPSFGWRLDASSAYPIAKLIVQPLNPNYKARGIGGMFDTGATITALTLQEQRLLRVRDDETVPCRTTVANNETAVGKLVVLNAKLEGDQNSFRLPVMFLPPLAAVLIGRAGLVNNFDIRLDPVNWLSDFDWRGPQLPPQPPGFPALPNPGWVSFWEQKIAEQTALHRTWDQWEAAGEPKDWLAHWV